MANQPNISDLLKSDIAYRIYYKSTNPKFKGQWLVDQDYITNAEKARIELNKFRQRPNVFRAEIVKEVTTRKVLS